MNVRELVNEITGRKVRIMNERVDEVLYTNYKHKRKSRPFKEWYPMLLNIAPMGSYLEWVKHTQNTETRKFRSRLRDRFNRFRSVREIVLYLHGQNYLAGKFGSPTPNEVEDLLERKELWYEPRNFTREEQETLDNFLGIGD